MGIDELYTIDDIRQWQKNKITEAFRDMILAKLAEIRETYIVTTNHNEHKGMEISVLNVLDMLDSQILSLAFSFSLSLLFARHSTHPLL